MAVLLLADGVRAGDWPMWRYDAARSAASPDAIANNPTLLWSRTLPPVRQAWPLETDRRTDFDASYEPVVLGQRLFIGSPNDGSVTAYDTATGAEQWKFYSEGPIRCAPACWNGRVYAGSDDGYLYCLDAHTGAVVWKFRGAPADRPDRRQLGNGHLVSLWPVRGGPVIVNGVVYFGAGIWPTFGVFLHAVDAGTGKATWTNGRLNYIANVRIDHEYITESGLSPQGHLVVIRDRLVVPCGRSMPAGLELATGKLIYYTQGYYGNGASRVAACGDVAFVGQTAMVNTYDFREVGSKWAYRGTNPPPGYVEGRALGPYQIPWDLLECPALPYKQATACDASSAFADGLAYGAANGTFYAVDVRNATLAEHEVTRAGKLIRPLSWQPPVLWQHKTRGAGQPSGVTIKAGNRIYGSAGKTVLALESLKGPPGVAWEKTVDGVPSSLAAADGKLFVATTNGTLYCFGQSTETAAVPRVYTGSPAATMAASAGEWSEPVQALVKATGATSGYGVVLGLKDGGLVEELLRQTDLHILGVDADPGKIDALRRRFSAAGYTDSRLELFAGTPPGDFSLPPYLANLVVTETSVTNAGITGTVFDRLHPYGGTLALRVPADRRQDFEAWARQAGDAYHELAGVRHAGAWSLLIRKGPLPGAAPWTHDAGDAAGTFLSLDERARAPLGILWYGDQNGCALDVHAGNFVTTKVNGGRVYVIQQQRPRRLFAYDAFTGRLLWQREFKSFYARFTALDDGIYLATEGTCTVFDPASGRTLNTFTFAAGGATTAKELVVDGDTILVACSPGDEQRGRSIPGRGNDETWMSDFYGSTTLVALDRQRGTELWRRQAKYGFRNRGLALAAGRVFCVDSMPPPPKGVAVTNCESLILALDARTGGEAWSRAVSYTEEVRQAKYPDQWNADWLACTAGGGMVLSGRQRLISAWDAATGRPLWSKKSVHGGSPLMLGDKTFIAQDGAEHDLATGALTNRIAVNRWGCNYAIASKGLLTVRGHSAGYTDLDTGNVYELRAIRSGCRNSLIPGDGLLNAPNYAMVCGCGYAVRTSFAMAHMPEAAGWAGSVPVVQTPPAARGSAAPTDVSGR
jgi:outer membrane protein assembly factor BamB